MRQRKELVLVMCLTLPILAAHESNATTCCTRHVTVDISGPAAEAGLAIAEWSSLFSSEGGSSPSQCPILIVGPGGCIDYQFKGVLSSGPAGRLDMKLVDCNHNTVVKVGSITWPCASFPNPCPDVMINFIVPFAAGFQPLNQIIDDYERIPVSCSVDPEKDIVEPDESMTVTVSEITDAQGRNSADFQWILAEAADGQILNGIEEGGLKGFQVDGGTVEVTYKAPSCCKKEDEDIYIYNSCWEKPEHPGPPENRIGKATFTKEPKVIEASIEYDHELIQKFPCVGCYRKNRITGTVPITINLEDRPPSIHGKGSVKSNLYGEGDGCTLSAAGMMTVSISGTLKSSGDDQQLLLVRFDENHAEDWTVHMVCPSKPEDSGNYSEVMGPPPKSKNDVWTLTFEDGYRLHLQANFSGMGWNNILHVPCLARCSE